MGREAERCPDCGAGIAGGRAGCQALFDRLSASIYRDPRRSRWHDLAFDTCCLQHPSRFCRSAKSYAAHLTRLCCGLEHEGSPKAYRAIQRWLNGKRILERPVEPAQRGRLTVMDLFPPPHPVEFGRRVNAWARDVWQAYASQQGLARAWVRAALDAPESSWGST